MIRLHMALSKNLEKHGSIEIGRYTFWGLSFLKTALTFAVFNFSEKTPTVNVRSIMFFKGLILMSIVSLTIFICMSSQPGA